MQLEGVAKLCAANGIPHVINNAYGVQSRQLCAHVDRACRVGRVDAVVQSTDKNFMVPVGGSIVAATARWPGVLQETTRRYPGRAAVAAHLDVLMTLLHLGKQGWQQQLQERDALAVHLQVLPTAFVSCIDAHHASRKQVAHLQAGQAWTVAVPPGISSCTKLDMRVMHAARCLNACLENRPLMLTFHLEVLLAVQEQLSAVATELGECVLASPSNPISFAMTLNGLGPEHATKWSQPPRSLPDGSCNDALAACAEAVPRSSATESADAALSQATDAKQANRSSRASGGNQVSPRHQAVSGAHTTEPCDAAAAVAPAAACSAEAQRAVTRLGAMLWQRRVNGVRVIARGQHQKVAGIHFDGYGSSCSAYPHHYLTAAAALGGTRAEVDLFVRKLRDAYLECKHRQ